MNIIDIKPTKKLSVGQKKTIQMMLVSYLLVVLGLFSWLPLFIFQNSSEHQLTIENTGSLVIWKMHHISNSFSDIKDSKSFENLKLHEKVVQTDDHELNVPSDEFVKYFLKVSAQAERILLYPIIILLLSFLTFLKLCRPLFLGRYFISIPIRNSIPILIRSSVLRH